MKKVAIAISLLTSMTFAVDYYGGVDIGFGKGSESLDSTSYDFSHTAYDLHFGSYLNAKSRIEVYFKSLTFDAEERNLKDEDGKQFGVDYIYAFNGSSVNTLSPYIGIGLTGNRKDVYITGLDEDSIDGIGFKLRGGTYYTFTSHLNIGIEVNYNDISWQDLKDLETGEIEEYSSSFYGLGLSINYKF